MAHRLQRDAPWPREGRQKESFPAEEGPFHPAGPGRAVQHRRIEPHEAIGIGAQDFAIPQGEAREIPGRVDEQRPWPDERATETKRHCRTMLSRAWVGSTISTLRPGLTDRRPWIKNLGR